MGCPEGFSLDSVRCRQHVTKTYKECKRKQGTNQKGFTICARKIEEDGKCDCVGKFSNFMGGQHTYIQHVDAKGGKWGYGFADRTGPEQAFDPDECRSCKKTSDKTDEEVKECIKNSQPTAPYSPTGYNCKAWAEEAAAKCGLDCES